MTSVLDSRASITSTENKVLELMRRGMTNREIAVALYRSEFTIKTHVQHILEKTGSRNRAQACAIVEYSSQARGVE